MRHNCTTMMQSVSSQRADNDGGSGDERISRRRGKRVLSHTLFETLQGASESHLSVYIHELVRMRACVKVFVCVREGV